MSPHIKGTIATTTAITSVDPEKPLFLLRKTAANNAKAAAITIIPIVPSLGNNGINNTQPNAAPNKSQKYNFRI